MLAEVVDVQPISGLPMSRPPTRLSDSSTYSGIVRSRKNSAKVRARAATCATTVIGAQNLVACVCQVRARGRVRPEMAGPMLRLP